MKILIVGDAPHLKTGFGQINGIAARAFQEAGYEVAAVSGLTLDPPTEELGYELFYPIQGDVLGILRAGEAIQEWQPDVVYHTGEPGTLTAFSRVVPARLPLVAYVPIEGEPIAHHDWRSILGLATIFTASEYGAKIIKRDVGIDVPWVYHGINHDVFKVSGRRDDLRRMFGWTDKFVLMTVATNVRRKQHPRLFEAVSLLKNRYHQKDIVLYDHTVPFNDFWLEGWHLPEVARSLGVEQEVLFNPAMGKNNAAIPDVGLYDGIGLVDLYNAADLFVLPSQVEGFGLPIAEAMACGLPVMVTKYAAGWEVASPAGAPIPVRDWEIHKSGTRYANADVEAMAKEILRLKRSPSERARRSGLGLKRVRDFRWEAYTEMLIATTKNALAKKAAEEVSPDTAQESQDTREDQSREESPESPYVNSTEAEDGLPTPKANDSPEGARADDLATTGISQAP